MNYLLLGIGLFVVLIIYLRLARRYAIMDTPNERSSHQNETVVGGGIVIPIAFIGWSLVYHELNLYLTGAVLLVSVVSIIDDLKKVNQLVRSIIQVAAIGIILYDLNTHGNTSSTFIVVLIGLVYLSWVNAFNFMDGINGMIVGYSILVIASLWFINEEIHFIDSSIMLATGIGVLVLSFFNFRQQALCFSGDVGSISLAVLLGYFLIKLIQHTGNYWYLMVVVVYGIDSAGTIIERLIKRENIFKPHRLHLYQLYVNYRNKSHLAVSIAYTIIQLLVNITFLLVVDLGNELWSIIYCGTVFVTLLAIYAFLKIKVFKVFEEERH